jgi:hypothetical protein
MEVSLENLPHDWTERGLERQLIPILDSLGIKEWKCCKPRRKAKGQLIFLHSSDAHRFIAKYGVQPRAGATTKATPPIFTTRPSRSDNPRMKLMNTLIYCRLTGGFVEKWLLASLKHEAEKRSARQETRSPIEAAAKFKIKNLSCGHYTMNGERLIYNSDARYAQSGFAKFTHRHLTIHIPEFVRLLIPLHTIVEIVSGTSALSMSITVTDTPIISHPVTLAESFRTLTMDRYTQNNQKWKRAASINADHARVVQHSLVYNFDILPDNYNHEMNKLRQRELLTITPYDLVWKPTAEGYREEHAALRERLKMYTKDNSLPFTVLFQLQKLVDNCYFPAAFVQNVAIMIHVLDTRKSGRITISADAIKRMMPKIDYLGPHTEPKDLDLKNVLMKLVEYERDIQAEKWQRIAFINANENMALVHQVIVTPSRILLEGPEWENNNRILRKFPDNHDYFIRVRFTDENGESIFFDPRMDQNEVYERFKQVMKRGIQIAGRNFSFLGFSHSSLRSQTVWFQAPFHYQESLHTYFSIITSIGKFSDIRSPAKCAARIGQAFSETPIAVPLDTYKVKVSRIEDIKSRDKTRVFSDGVGTISQDLVDIINNVHLPNSRGSATCFQIRYGGAKGMLSLDKRLTGRQICLRPSMEKFPSEDTAFLELCGMASGPIPMVLNRQLIKILEDLNVSNDWFFRLQNDELHRLRYVLRSGSSIAKFLRSQNVGESFGLSQLYQFIHEYQWEFREDTFLRSAIETVVLQQLRLLKHKARIPVDEGVTLFGILDETGFLKEGEVYVAFNHPDGMISGQLSDRPVLVTRSPALHAGDIQLVNHVNPPLESPLSQLSNCIVFSQHGSRDLPSMLSGGDLDGDLYNVIWAGEVLTNKLRTHKPANYPRTAAIVLHRPVEKEDMMDFFIEFMKTDILGVIATRHMIVADQQDSGTLDHKCVKLAELHSTAVDFSKSGKSVKLNELPLASRFRPDL